MYSEGLSLSGVSLMETHGVTSVVSLRKLRVPSTEVWILRGRSV